MSEPLIVLTAPRSCSTVLVAILDGHPRLRGVPELSLLPSRPMGELLSTRFSMHTSDGVWHRHALLRAMAWLQRGSLEDTDLLAAVHQLQADPGLTSADVLQQLAAHAAPDILIDKSPLTAGSTEALADCLTAFPSAGYLHLVRHPITTAWSQVRHWRWRGIFPWESTETLLARAMFQWYSTHRRISAVLGQRDPASWRMVRAEELRESPAATLTSLLRWLDLEADESIIARMLQTERWVFSDSKSPVGGDKGFFADPTFRSQAPEYPDWTDLPSAPDDALERISGLAAVLGYSPDHLVGATT